MPRTLDTTDVMNESVLTTPPRFRRSTRSMSRALEDDSFNQSSDNSLLDISLDVPKKRSSRSKKSPSPSPQIPAPTITTTVGTRPRTRSSMSLNESVLATPSPMRRSKRSRSRQPDEDDGDDVSLIDDSMNKSSDDSVLESSLEAPKRPRTRKSISSNKGNLSNRHQYYWLNMQKLFRYCSMSMRSKLSVTRVDLILTLQAEPLPSQEVPVEVGVFSTKASYLDQDQGQGQTSSTQNL